MTREEAIKLLRWDGVSSVTLKIAYHRCVFKCHPDRGGVGINDVVRAYELLRAPYKRSGEVFRRKLTESGFQQAVIQAVRRRGGFVFNVHGGPMQMAGMPDLYIASLLWTGWLELKVTARVAPLQQERIKQLLKQGVPAGVLRWAGQLQFEHEGEIVLQREWTGNELQRGESLLQACQDFTDQLPLKLQLRNETANLLL